MDTTIKVDSTVRDRLAVLAGERGTSVRDLVSELAMTLATRYELDLAHAEATAYLRTHVCPELGDTDLAGGERFWQGLEARHGGRSAGPGGDTTAS